MPNGCLKTHLDILKIENSLIGSKKKLMYRSNNKLLFFLLFVLLIQNNVFSQDLEPGFLSALPIGGNIGIASYGYSQGEILLDKALPIEDLNAKMSIIALGYFRSFKLFNRLAKFDVVVPYAIGDYSGLLEGEGASTYRNGFGDPLVRISMILIGADPLKPQDFFKKEQKKFKLGVALRAKAPIGQYDPEKFINLGANRWALRAALAGSYTIKNKLVLESHFSGWFFQENDNFYGGNSLKQEPLWGLQFHATYIFKPGIWLAASIGGVRGGKTQINGVGQTELNNDRYGLAFAYRLNNKNSLKVAYTNAFFTASGSDFDTYLLAYQFLWFDKK